MSAAAKTPTGIEARCSLPQSGHTAGNLTSGSRIGLSLPRFIIVKLNAVEH
jgi:hypothetical protein